MAMIAASNEYFRRMGSYPNSISDLFQFCSANPGSCSLDPRLASGKVGGYVYMLNGTGVGGTGAYQIESEPEVAGITGSVTLTMDQTGTITSMATPGSDAARQRAFDNILVSGAKTVVDLLALDSTGAATDQVRAYTGASTINAGTLTSAFATLDTSRDGRVSVNECSTFLTSDPAGPTFLPLKAFNYALTRELRLDTLDAQAGQDIMVATGDLDITQPSLFSYDELQYLTRIVFNGGAGDDTLAANLQSAEDAEASGNLNRKAKALKQYRKRVKSLIGTSVTRTNSNTLIALSNCLVSS